MALHHTVLLAIGVLYSSTYQQLRYSEQLESRLATLDSSQEALLLRVMCSMDIDINTFTLQSNQPNDKSVKIPSARKTNQQPAGSHKSSMSRHLHLTVFQLAVACWLGVYIHGQVAFCVHGLQSFEQ